MIRLILASGERHALRWTDQRPESSYGLGVVLYARSGAILDADTFRQLAYDGARIECGDHRDVRRVAGALAWSGADLPADSFFVSGG